jgi:hypothetical protein
LLIDSCGVVLLLCASCSAELKREEKKRGASGAAAAGVPGAEAAAAVPAAAGARPAASKPAPSKRSAAAPAAAVAGAGSGAGSAAAAAEAEESEETRRFWQGAWRRINDMDFAEVTDAMLQQLVQSRDKQLRFFLETFPDAADDASLKKALGRL